MTGVKSRRSYRSPVRQAQAAETRARILAAARSLFERQGYEATAMSEIASEAGVAPKTVYVAFESKSGLLRALWHLLLRGDEDPAPVGERTWYREVLDEADPARQLELNARNSRVVKERVSALLEVLRNAAQADREIGELWDRIQAEFHENQRAVVRSLHRKRALRRGLSVERAADVLWTLNHPNVYRLLVVDRGWSPAQYEAWLAQASRAELLADGR